MTKVPTGKVVLSKFASTHGFPQTKHVLTDASSVSRTVIRPGNQRQRPVLRSRLEQTNLPVGLFSGAEYSVGITTLRPGAGVILVSDGVTEAEDAKGDFFGDERLDSAALCADLKSILERMTDFCAGHPANDDCTIVQIVFTGHCGYDSGTRVR